MKIGISTRGLKQGSFAISSIVLHLSQAIFDLAANDHELYLYFNNPEYEALFSRATNRRSIKLNHRFLWDHAWLPGALKRDAIDIALFMKGTMPWRLPCKGAVIYHDLGYFDDQLRPYRFMETIYMKYMMARAGRKAAVSFTDSEYTRKQAIDILGIDPGKIHVCYQNCSPEFHPITDSQTLQAVQKEHNLPGTFIFCPISLSPRKNLVRILAAFEEIKAQIPHSLVVTGGQSWGMRDQLKRKDRVHVLGSVPFEDLPALYNLADFTIYPSLLEGFGLPILEAFRCGCPVLTSNITSMPEVAGGAAYLVDPYDACQIAEGMRALASDEKLRGRLVRKGFERAKFFSWEKTAKIILGEMVNG